MPTSQIEHRYPCDNCGGSLQFAPGRDALICPYCGHLQHISAGAPVPRTEGRDPLPGVPAAGRAIQWDAGHKSPQLEEIPLEQGLSLDVRSDLTETVRTLSCPNCGAKIERGTDTHAGT